MNVILRSIFIMCPALVLMGCGSSQSGSSIAINSAFINLQNTFPETYSLTNDLFNQDTINFNQLVGQNILFQPNSRLVNVVYGDLDPGILGLTECVYESDGTSSCTINLSNTIDPDQSISESDQETRTQTFVGVLRHELGHAFGLGHIKKDVNNVMYPYFNTNQLSDNSLNEYIINLNNFRINGEASGLPDINVK
jgi:hypothetical protein